MSISTDRGRKRKETRTMAEDGKPVEVSRRIEAPAALIFKILANPRRHMDFDGSGMLRGAVFDRPISDVGDNFTMKMHRLGDDYLMLNYVVEFEPDRRIFGNRLPETLLGPRVMIHPRSAFLRATAGATSIPDGDDATLVTEVFDYGPLPEGSLTRWWDVDQRVQFAG